MDSKTDYLQIFRADVGYNQWQVVGFTVWVASGGAITAAGVLSSTTVMYINYYWLPPQRGQFFEWETCLSLPPPV